MICLEEREFLCKTSSEQSRAVKCVMGKRTKQERGRERETGLQMLDNLVRRNPRFASGNYHDKTRKLYVTHTQRHTHGQAECRIDHESAASPTMR